MQQADPYSYVHIDGDTPIYLPSSLVRAEQEKAARKRELIRAAIFDDYQHEEDAALLKGQGSSPGRLFSDTRSVHAGIGPGLDKPTNGLPFELLRELADASPIDRLIIDTRIMQMKRVSRRAIGRNAVGFAVRHARHNDPDFDVPEGLRKLCREIEALISTPTAPFHQTVRDFFTMAIDEELTIDRKAMVISRDRRGRPVRFHLVDGATVKPVPTVLFDEIQKEYDRTGRQRILSSYDYDQYMYRLSEQSGIDLYRAAYVQVLDGQIVGGWRDSEMSIDITNPSARVNWWGYGRSLLEKSWRMSDTFLKAWLYNNELFGLNYPEAVLIVKGRYNEKGLQAFKRKVLGEGDAVDRNWRLPVIPMEDDRGTVEVQKLRDTPKDMMFQEFLQTAVRLKCAAYRMHPSLINFSVESSSGGSLVFQSNASQEDVISLSQEEGYHALLDSIADWITRVIVQEYHEDLVFCWVGLDQESEDARVERVTKKVNSFITINEARAEMGLKPLPAELPTEPGDFVGSYTQAIQTIQGQQQLEAQQGGDGYDEGDFGDDSQERFGQQGQDDQQQRGAPQAPRPQRGGPQHLDEESKELQRSRSRRVLTIEAVDL